MAITVSGWYTQNMVDVFDPTQLALDLTLATYKVALLSNAATPAFDTDISFNTTNEVFGTGWASGGVLLSAAAAGGTSTAPTVTISPAGTMMWDMNDLAVANTTVTNLRAFRFYADPLTSPADPLILLINAVSDFSTVNGTLGLTFSPLGVAVVDWTP